MARPLRIEFPGAIYHVTSRGDRREAIYQDDDDRLDPGNNFGWCTVCRFFVTDVSKTHDWFNSWNYSSTGQFIGLGVAGNSAFDALYSFPGMPTEALVTAGSYLGSEGIILASPAPQRRPR